MISPLNTEYPQYSHLSPNSCGLNHHFQPVHLFWITLPGLAMARLLLSAGLLWGLGPSWITPRCLPVVRQPHPARLGRAAGSLSVTLGPGLDDYRKVEEGMGPRVVRLPEIFQDPCICGTAASTSKLDLASPRRKKKVVSPKEWMRMDHIGSDLCVQMGVCSPNWRSEHLFGGFPYTKMGFFQPFCFLQIWRKLRPWLQEETIQEGADETLYSLGVASLRGWTSHVAMKRPGHVMVGVSLSTGDVMKGTWRQG